MLGSCIGYNLPDKHTRGISANWQCALCLVPAIKLIYIHVLAVSYDLWFSSMMPLRQQMNQSVGLRTRNTQM